MNINLKIRFNIGGGKVHEDQEATQPDLDVKTSKRVRMTKNDNTYDTHKETSDKAEETLNPKK